MSRWCIWLRLVHMLLDPWCLNPTQDVCHMTRLSVFHVSVLNYILHFRAV